MSHLEHANSFRDLVVHQKAGSLAKRVFQVTRSFPREEVYSLTDQVRRSSRSVGAQIAEAWAKRRYARHIVSKLTDAEGEQQETQPWIDIAADCGYLDDPETASFSGDLAEIGRMLNSMIEKSDLFCGGSPFTLQEAAADYFVSNADCVPISPY